MKVSQKFHEKKSNETKRKSLGIFNVEVAVEVEVEVGPTNVRL
jgi:hypothetical protein